MTLEIWLAIGGVAIAAILLLSTLRLQRKRQPTAAEQKWIMATLESIREEADRKRLNANAEPKFDVEAAFNDLRELMATHPGPLQEKIEVLAGRWKELDVQFAEFQGNDPGSTLQNSIMATRINKLANEIGELIEEIESGLSVS